MDGADLGEGVGSGEDLGGGGDRGCIEDGHFWWCRWPGSQPRAEGKLSPLRFATARVVRGNDTITVSALGTVRMGISQLRMDKLVGVVVLSLSEVDRSDYGVEVGRCTSKLWVGWRGGTLRQGVLQRLVPRQPYTIQCQHAGITGLK